jgi:hypothetical protein
MVTEGAETKGNALDALDDVVGCFGGTVRDRGPAPGK